METRLRIVKKDEENVATAATMTESAPGLPDRSPPPEPVVLKYDVAGEHARGGIGRVLRAWDRRLNRLVAIKELLAARGDHSRRFVREVEITARLQHPSIVPVYEAGQWPDGKPFFAMKFVSGRSLKQLIDEAGTLDKRLALLPNMIAVVDAIAYAHSQGVLHRDLKPSNVLVGDFGETVVVDWGLAKSLADAHDAGTDSDAPYRGPADCHTVAGAVMGTPSYMPPEQARGATIDARADVYSLGAMLYHILAGEPPFSGESSAVVLNKVIAGPPISIEQRESGAPPDLATIVQKAMARDPGDRYPSAGALAEDLRRFQTGQLVGAHQYSSGALIRRWVKRNKLASAATATFLVVLAITTAVSIRRIRHERSVAVAERNRLILAQARSALDSDPTLAIEWLETYPLDGVDWDGVQITAADAQSRGIARHLLPTMSKVMDLLPDNRRLVVGGPAAEASVWDFVSGTRLRSRTFESSVSFVSASPDGETVAVTDRGGEVFVWTWRDNKLRRLGVHKGAALRIAFSHTGERLASSSRDTVIMWNVVTGREEAALRSPESITTLQVAPDDAVAFGTMNGALELWQPATGAIRHLTGHVGAVNRLSFSPDGKLILTGGKDHTVRLWERATGRGRILGAHDDLVRVVAFSPDGTMAITGGKDNKVRIWSLNGKAPRVLAGHTELVSGANFSPDGRTVASSSQDRTIRLWDLATGEDRVLSGTNCDLGAVEFSRDGATIVSGTLDSQTRVWNISDPPGTILGRHGVGARYLAVSPDNKWVVSTDTEKFARLWDITTGQERPLPGADWTAMELAASPEFSADSRRLAAGGGDRVRVWDLMTGRTQLLMLDSGSASRVILSPDGATVAIISTDGKIRLWKPETGAQRVLSNNGETGIGIEFADDRTLFSLSGDNEVRRWDLQSLRAESLGHMPDEPVGFAMTADRRTLAASDTRGHIGLWDLAGSTVRTLDAPTPRQRLRLYLLQFSTDGRELAATSDQITTRVWNLASGDSRTLRSHDKLVRAIAFSRDGRWLATGSEDRAIHLRDLQQDGFAVLRGHRGAVLSVAFSNDGKFLFSASEDGSVRRWYMDRVHLVPRDSDALRAWMKEQTTATLRPTELASSTAQQQEGSGGERQQEER
jgi:WD40 repeat protein